MTFPHQMMIPLLGWSGLLRNICPSKVVTRQGLLVIMLSQREISLTKRVNSYLPLKHMTITIKKGVVREVLKCSDAEYKLTLKGTNKGLLGPIFIAFIEAIFILEFVHEYIARVREESKKVSRMQTLFDVYITE